MFRDIVLKNRSYRRFDESHTVDTETMRELVDLARHTASASNLQSLKYIITTTPERNQLVFDTLSWAGYYHDWHGPSEGERPTAYIVVLGDTSISKNYFCDHGIVSQTILLGATEKGLGGCMFMAIDRDALRRNLIIDERYDILMAIAIGKPVEEVVIETVGEDGSVKYWRDEDGRHHVPKRKLDELIISQ